MSNLTIKLEWDNFNKEFWVNEQRLNGKDELRNVVTVKTITPWGWPTPWGTIVIVDQNGIEHTLITT